MERLAAAIAAACERSTRSWIEMSIINTPGHFDVECQTQRLLPDTDEDLLRRRSFVFRWSSVNLLAFDRKLASCLLFGSDVLSVYADYCYLIGSDHGWQASKDLI